MRPSLANRVLTIAVAALVVLAAIPFVRWTVIDATWTGTADTCRSGSGACWAFIGHKLPFILYGLYPTGERWRAAAATAILIMILVLSATPRLWNRWLALGWVAGLAVVLWLLGGGAGLEPVPTEAWGGLPITLMLTAVGLALGFPLAILLALARRSHHRLPRLVATAFVETTRGIPLIAVLYLAVLIFPLAMPVDIEVDKLLLAQVGITLFASAYLAEAVRSGLQMVPKGRLEAALALGLGWWPAMRLVVLPESLRIVTPSFVSIAVGFFQDTSLIVIIGLFDLLNTSRLAAQDPAWLGFSTEAYLFVGVIYLAGSGAIALYGRWLERYLA